MCQLEEARKPGQEDKAEDPQEQPDIPSEDNAIEMSDDFDGKLHNKDGAGNTALLVSYPHQDIAIKPSFCWLSVFLFY